MGGQDASGEYRRGVLPLGLAFFSITLCVLLFLTGAVPALREASDLRGTEQHNRQQLSDLLERGHDLRQRQQALEWDPQTVLVEIDRLGLLPGELLEDSPTPK